MADEQLASEADVDKLMSDKALEIFRLCDHEQKGLVTKSDLCRLSTELPLSTAQLEQVFDSLDVHHNGFLTAAEFTHGFGQFLGLSEPRGSFSRQLSRLPSIVYEDEACVEGVDIDENDRVALRQFDEMLNNLSADRLLDNVDVIKSIWLRLNRQSDQDLINNFRDFLCRMISELQRTNLDYQALQTKFNNNSFSHNEEIEKLYEEMESQIFTENQRIKNQERLKEQRIKELMMTEMEEKDNRLQELLSKQQQLEEKLAEMNTQQTRTRQENEKLVKEKEEMAERLGSPRHQLPDEQLQVARQQHQQNKDTDIRSLAAVQIIEWIELERENLIRQLESIRETSRELRDFQDETSMPRTPRKQTEQKSTNEQNLTHHDSLSADDVDVGLRREPIGANSTITDKQQTDPTLETSAQVAERLFKIVFVGDSGVGKSTFIHRFCCHTFHPGFSATIGVDFQVKNIKVDGHLVSLQLWDTAGQERFRSLTKHYFRKADGIIVMYDVTCLHTFNNVRDWMHSIQDGIEDGAVVVLLGNKIDLVEEKDVKRFVSTDSGDKLAMEFDTLFYETSSKTGQNIDTSIIAMTRLLCEREDERLQEVSGLAMKVDLNAATKKKLSCC